MYKKILVPVDGSETAALGLAEAIQLAKTQDASIRLVHIVNEFVMAAVPPYGIGSGAYTATAMVDALRENGKKTLQDAQARVHAAGVKVETVLEEMIGSQSGAHIVQQAASWPADLIVMGTHGRRGIRRMVMGSDAEYVVRHTPVPVLLIRGRKSPEESR